MADRLQALTRQGRAQAQVLLAGADDPHAEVLALVWGPRFDRDHARDLAAPLVGRFPHAAGPVLDALMDVGERFDRLEHAAQQRIRRLILRHRALSDALH